MFLDRIRDHWVAWQETSYDDQERGVLKQGFAEILQAVRGSGEARPELQDLVTAVGGLLPEMLQHLRRRTISTSDEVILYRGIYDFQAQDVLRNLLLGRTYQLRQDQLLSFTYDAGVAGGFAWKGAWGGITLCVPVRIADVVFAPDIFGWRTPLGRECEVLVLPDRPITLTIDSLLCAVRAQFPTGTREQIQEKLELRPQLEQAWNGWMASEGLTHELLQAAFAAYKIGAPG